MRYFSLLFFVIISIVANALEVKNLRVEDYRNPIGIDVTCPHLSWELSSDQRGVTQESYNICIATDAQMSNIVWDSGIIKSGQNVDVLIQGFTAQLRTRYYWNVTVTDNHGNQAASQQKAYFETSLLDEQQWGGATWIKATTTPIDYTPDEKTITDYEITLSFEVQNQAAGFIFGTVDHNNFYMWQFNNSTGTARFRPHQWTSGTATCLTEKTLTGTSLTAGKVHQLRIVVTGGTEAQTYLNGSLIDTRTGNFPYGECGFRQFGGSNPERAYFDNFKINSGDKTLIEEDFNDTTCIFHGGELIDGRFYASGPSKYFWQNEQGCPILRKTFATQDKDILRARLYATALGVYNVYINGQRVGITDDDGNTIQDELKPGSTDYNKTLFYTTHDVTKLLTAGKNAIGAELSTGWWNGAIAHSVFGNKDNAFRGLLVITYTDGTEQQIPTDLTWLSQWNGPLRSGDLYNGEEYDARLQTGWSTPTFNDTNWYQTAVSTDFKGLLQAFRGGPVITVPDLARQPQTIKIYDTTESTGTTYGALHLVQSYTSQHAILLKAGQTAIYDMGQNASGWVSFKALGKSGTKLRFRFAEMCNETGDSGRGEDGPAGSVYLANLRTAVATLYYTLAGKEGGESFHPTSTYFGFRYIEITTSEDVELSDVIGETLTTSMDESSDFSCSHTDINQLYSNIMWGERSNFISVPTDCPQRDERLGWGADTQVFSMAGLYNADSRNFYKKWVQDMRDSQREDGAYPLVAPYIWGDRGYGQGGWAEAGLIVPYNVYLMTGDKEVMRDNYTSMQRHMEWCAAQAGDGYLYNGASTKYGDWLAYKATDKRYTSVCYYAYAAQLMRDMAQALSESDNDQYAQDAQTYQTLFENIRAEWQKRYLSTQKVPTEATQCAYLMALHYNLLPSQTSINATIKKLQSAIRSNVCTLNTGFLGTAILNQTLSDYNLNTEAYTLLLQRNCPSWLYSIDQGATTMWERWNSYTKADGMGSASMNSFNHYAYGAIADWMYRYMAGISPDAKEPGFHHFILQPTPDDRTSPLYHQQRITWTDATFHSDYGPIRAKWQWEELGRITYEVEVPANTTATLYMPCPDGYEIHESGTSVDKAEGVTLIGNEDGKTILELGSGSYVFSTATADGIQKITEGNNDAPHYTLDGIKLPNHPTRKGIYIHNNKKIAY